MGGYLEPRNISTFGVLLLWFGVFLGFFFPFIHLLLFVLGKALSVVLIFYSFPQERSYIWFYFLVYYFPKLKSLFSFISLLSLLFRLVVVCVFTYKRGFISFCLRRIAHFGNSFEAVSIFAYIFLLP